DNVELAKQPAVAQQMAALQVQFDDAHAERKQLMIELAALPGRPSDSPDKLRAYQDSVVRVTAIRAQAIAVVGGQKETNDIFCRYIVDDLPPMLLGVIIAAIDAAAMSSIHSVLNAMSGATVLDFYRRWLKPTCSEALALRVGKFSTLSWGVVATLAALFF